MKGEGASTAFVSEEKWRHAGRGRGTFGCDGWPITPEEASANFNTAPSAQLLLLSSNHGNKLKEGAWKIAHLGLTLHRYTQWGFGWRWLRLIMCSGGACAWRQDGLAVMPDLHRWDRGCNLNASGRQFKHMAVWECLGVVTLWSALGLLRVC